MEKICEWRLPIYTISEANSTRVRLTKKRASSHWSAFSALHDVQKRWIALWFRREKPNLPLPCLIKLTRVATRKLDAKDNLPMSLKYVADAIADSIFPGLPPGKADDSPLLSWVYDQEIGKEYEVVIQFFSP